MTERTIRITLSGDLEPLRRDLLRAQLAIQKLAAERQDRWLRVLHDAFRTGREFERTMEKVRRALEWRPADGD